MISAKHGFRITIIFQFLLRLYLIFPLSLKIIKTAGVVVEAAWAGAAFNLMLFMLASHVSFSLVTGFLKYIHICGTKYLLEVARSRTENYTDS